MQYGKSRKSEDRVIILLWLKKRHTFINDGTTCSNTVVGRAQERKNCKRFTAFISVLVRLKNT